MFQFLQKLRGEVVNRRLILRRCVQECGALECQAEVVDFFAGKRETSRNRIAGKNFNLHDRLVIAQLNGRLASKDSDPFFTTETQVVRKKCSAGFQPATVLTTQKELSRRACGETPALRFFLTTTEITEVHGGGRPGFSVHLRVLHVSVAKKAGVRISRTTV